MAETLSQRALAASRRPKTAPKSYAPAPGSVANVAPLALIKNFGNTKFSVEIAAALSAADSDGGDKLKALKAGFEADAVKELACDDIWAGIKEAENGGDANAVLRGPVTNIRNDIRANYGFGQKLRSLKTADKPARLGFASALLADMVDDGVNPSRITANNIVAQCSSMSEAEKHLSALEVMGVQPNESTDLTLLHVAIAASDLKAAGTLVKGLEKIELGDYHAKILANQKAQIAKLQEAKKTAK